MHKTLVQTLLAAFCAILAHAPLEGGGVMLIGMRNAMFGGAKLSAKSYVQDGLVAMWDGIENAGWGVHDANATVWKDLVGNYDMGLFGAFTIEDKCVHFEKASSGYPLCPTGFGTLESVFWKRDLANDGSGDNCIITFGNVYSGWGLCARNNSISDTNDKASLCIYFSAGETLAVSVLYGSLTNVSTEIYKNGILSTTKTSYSSKYNLGSDSINSRGGYNGRNSDLRHYSIRVYSRALTADEIAANCAVDKARFNLPDAT